MPRPATDHSSLIILRHGADTRSDLTRTPDVFVVLLVHEAHCDPGYPDSQGEERVGPDGASFPPELPPLPEAEGQGRHGEQEEEGVGEAEEVPQAQGGRGVTGGGEHQGLEDERDLD